MHRHRHLERARHAVALGLLLLGAQAHGETVRVAVAANFAPTMDALVARFETAGGGEHDVLVSVASTGSHYAQIVNGAPFDVFFAADRRRPERLERDGVAVAGTRFTYAVGRLALWSTNSELVDAEGRVLESGRFRHLAIANPELAPYGRAAREVLRGRGLWETLQSKLVRGQDVGQTYSFVHTRNAELGFVAYSQLGRPGRDAGGSYWLVPESLHAAIEQQAVLLEETPGARAFVEFVHSAEARAIIGGYGYGP